MPTEIQIHPIQANILKVFLFKLEEKFLGLNVAKFLWLFGRQN